MSGRPHIGYVRESERASKCIRVLGRVEASRTEAADIWFLPASARLAVTVRDSALTASG